MMTYREATERFVYNAVTGELRTKLKIRAIFFQDKAPRPHRSMREVIFIDGRRVPAALVAWVLYTGQTPRGPVSVVSKDWTDIRAENLKAPSRDFPGTFSRPSTKGRRVPSGVTWCRTSGRWKVRKSYLGKVQEVGDFFSLWEAIEKYFAWKKP